MTAVDDQVGKCVTKRAMDYEKKDRILNLLNGVIQVPCRRVVLQEFGNRKDKSAET